MKLFKSIFVLLILSVFSFTACAQNTPKEDTKTMKVYTSVYPMYFLTNYIAGDLVSVENIVPTGIEPHEWEPSPNDIKNLEKANLFIYNGAYLEHWVPDVLKSLTNKDLVVVDASKNLELIKNLHPDLHPGEKDHDDDEGLQYNSHVWLYPMNYKKQAEVIKDSLVSLDPDNKQVYEKNFESLSLKLDNLDSLYRERINALPNKSIIVSHEAFGYLCNAYGLEQIGVQGIDPNAEPDPARLAEVIDIAKAKNIKVIFFDELVSPKVAETIAREVGASVDVLNPIEGLTTEQQKNGDDYFTIMEENLSSLEEALK